MGRLRRYDGDSVRVTFEPSRCLHAAACVRGLPAVFDRNRKPWIDATGASAGEIAEVVRHCPTGALKCERTDGEPPEAGDELNTITVSADGPLFARGDIRLEDADRRPLARETRAAFCRCGASRHKPFCDGSHLESGFEAPASLAEGRLKPVPDPEVGPLSVRLRADGPLILEGPVRINGGDSDDFVHGGGCALCRCGASSRKPWCDGSHNSIGFVAEDPKTD